MGDGIRAGRLVGRGKVVAAVATAAAGVAAIALSSFGDTAVNSADPPPITSFVAIAPSTTATINSTVTTTASTEVTSTPGSPATTTSTPTTAAETTVAASPTTRLDALRQALASLGVADLGAPRPAYDRNEYQPGGWPDSDGDCQNDRHEVLQRDSTGPVVLDASGCHVLTGTWPDAYDGNTWTSSAEVSVDHFVPIAHAHRVGGWRWDLATKQAFADDMIDRAALVVVGSAINEKKSDNGPADWKPPAESGWCRYAGDWIDEIVRWQLPLESEAERLALSAMLDRCGTAGSVPLRENAPPPAAVTTSTTTIPPTTTITASGLPRAQLVECAKREETVTIANGGETAMDISGWILHDDGPNHTFVFPDGTSIPSGATLTVLTGPGAANARPGEIAWKTDNVWNNSGDTAHLVDPAGVDQTLSCT